MKTSIEKFLKKSGRRIRCRALLFLFIILSVSDFTMLAQDSSATAPAPADSSAAAASGGPSLSNMKKTGTAMTEEMKKMKERQERDELLGYVYMVLGFGLVIAVAWFSTVKAKQIRERKEEEKRKFLEAKLANQAKNPQRNSATHRKGHRR